MEFTGAKWWKIDFHTHTPASKDYGKGLDSNEVTEITPRKWLLQHMRKGIDCVVVTDHNTGEWIDKLKKELNTMKEEDIEGYRNICIFPGVEISVNGGIHLLAIFDLDKTTEDITFLLGQLEYSGSRGDSNGVTKPNLNEAIDIIHNSGGIAIPAHVDKVKGLFKELNGPTLEETMNNKNLLAIELCDMQYTKPQLYYDNKLNLTEIIGTDSHNLDSIGNAYTWVKMEKPNLKALNLALHDGKDGVIRIEEDSNNPNDIYDRSYIKSLEINNGTKIGRGKPLSIEFSPWMNSIIGGRGSGKSSIIEFMRLPLNQRKNMPSKVQGNFDKFTLIPQNRGELGMLQEDTEIKMVIYKDGRDVELTWKDNKITEKSGNDNKVWTTQEELDSLTNRFPVRIFSQKHLYELTEDSNFIINIIDEQWDKPSWNEKKQKLSQEWLNNRSKARLLEKELKNMGNLKAILSDLEAKIEIYNKSEYQKILQEYQYYQSTTRKISEDKIKVSEYLDNLTSLYNNSSEKIYEDEIYNKLDHKSLEIMQEKNEMFTNIQNKLHDNINELKELIANIDSSWQRAPVVLEKNQNNEKYNEIMEELRDSNTKEDNYDDLISMKVKIERKINQKGRFESDFNDLQTQGITILQNIEEHQQILRKERQNVIANWVEGNDNIKVYLNEMKDKEKAEKTFRSLIRKEGKTFSKEILDFEENEGLVYELLSSENVWRTRKDIVNRISKIDSENQQNFGKRFYQHLLNIKSETPEDIDRIMIWYPEDKITLKMVSENKQEEDIASGSAGQRTAAMLSLMLRLDNTPIIIDQPEEDLDTRRITDLVVKDLKTLKRRQQIIVITHNPNIPVNGASENIIQMNFARGQINKYVEGALQKEEVRKSVCEIMEGGKDALDKRYYRVSKALNNTN